MSFKGNLILSLLSICAVFSCSHQQALDEDQAIHFKRSYGFDYQRSERTPAAATENCSTSMKYILVKRNRSKGMAQLIKDGDLDGLKLMIHNSHDGERLDKPIPYTAWYRKLRRMNKSHHVPALFQSKNKLVGDVDTFSTILKVVDDDITFGEHEKAAMEDILSWAEHIQQYQQRLNKVIEYGFEVRSTLNRLKDHLKNDKSFAKRNFPKDVSVPMVDKEGRVIESEIYFESVDDLKEFINEKEAEVVLTFSQNMFDEVFKKSRIYDVLVDQAVYYRRLELVMERLNSIPKGKLSDDQVALKDILEEVMANPVNRPRADAALFVRKKERSAELWASLRFWKSKRVEKDAKYKIPDKVLEQARAVSPYGLMIKSMAVVTLVTTPLTIIYNDNPWVQYMTSSIENRISDFMVFTLGLPTSSLSACYKSERSWSIEEASTMNSFLESHLGRYTAYQRIDPSYDPEDDEEYMKKKVELQAMCLKMRMEFKSADRHLANKELLGEHGYRFASHMVLIDLARSDYQDEELGELMYQYFEESEILENSGNAARIMEQIRAHSDDDFVTKLKQYQEDVDVAVSRVKDGSMDIYYPDSDKFFEIIEEYKDAGE